MDNREKAKELAKKIIASNDENEKKHYEEELQRIYAEKNNEIKKLAVVSVEKIETLSQEQDKFKDDFKNKNNNETKIINTDNNSNNTKNNENNGSSINIEEKKFTKKNNTLYILGGILFLITIGSFFIGGFITKIFKSDKESQYIQVATDTVELKDREKLSIDNIVGEDKKEIKPEPIDEILSDIDTSLDNTQRDNLDRKLEEQLKELKEKQLDLERQEEKREYEQEVEAVENEIADLEGRRDGEIRTNVGGVNSEIKLDRANISFFRLDKNNDSNNNEDKKETNNTSSKKKEAETTSEKREEFLNRENTKSPISLNFLIPSVSKYELKTGSVIPAVLLTEINTDMPGSILATVKSDIYDSITGNHLLIPKGSKLWGKYDSDIDTNQERVLIVYTRLTLPNGKSIYLDNNQALDQKGSAGLKDIVDRHTWDLMKKATMSTVLGMGSNLARNFKFKIGPVEFGTTTDKKEDPFSKVYENILEKEIDKKPTLIIKAGYEFNVLVNQDLILEAYK